MARKPEPFEDGVSHLDENPDEQLLHDFFKQSGSMELAQRAFKLHNRLVNVMDAYSKKGFQIPSWQLRQGHYSPEQDATILPTADANSITNRITTYGNFEKWHTPGEIDFVLAHEVGHIVVDQSKWLNPHRYMYHLSHPLTALHITLGTLATTILAPARMKKTIFCSTLFGSSYVMSLPQIIKSYRTIIDEDKKPVGYKFQCLQKFVEFECDLLAALVLPEGGKHAACYFQTLLDHEGDLGGADHPIHSTRLKYCKAIQWLQQHGVAKHT